MKFTKFISSTLIVTLLAGNFSHAAFANGSNSTVVADNQEQVQEEIQSESTFNISEELGTEVEMDLQKNGTDIEVEMLVDNEDTFLDATMQIDTNEGLIYVNTVTKEDEDVISNDYEVFISEVSDDVFIGTFINLETGEEYYLDTTEIKPALIPVAAAIAIHIVRFGAQAAAKKYGQKAVTNAVKDSLAKAVQSIPKKLFKNGEKVDLGKFTKTIKKSGDKEDPKTGWRISRDKAKDKSHGGSYWKLLNKNGKRIVTLDKDGKVLRE